MMFCIAYHCVHVICVHVICIVTYIDVTICQPPSTRPWVHWHPSAHQACSYESKVHNFAFANIELAEIPTAAVPDQPLCSRCCRVAWPHKWNHWVCKRQVYVVAHGTWYMLHASHIQFHESWIIKAEFSPDASCCEYDVEQMIYNRKKSIQL